MCFHCVPLDESQLHDSHLLSCVERSAAPLFYEYNALFSSTSESFPQLTDKIHTVQGADKCQWYFSESTLSANTNLDIQS